MIYPNFFATIFKNISGLDPKKARGWFPGTTQAAYSLLNL
jgi:hypothetical protein